MPARRSLRPGLGPRSHEGQGHGGGDAFRRAVLDGAVEVDRADAEIAAAGGEHLADELVVGLVLGDRRPHPAVIGLGRVGPEIDGELGLDPQHVAPFHRPVVGELVALQQAVDQQPALVLRVGVLDELAGLLARWAACRSRPGRRGGRTPRRNRARAGCPATTAWRKRACRSGRRARAGRGFRRCWAPCPRSRVARCGPASDRQEHGRGNQPRRSHAFQLRAGGISFHLAVRVLEFPYGGDARMRWGQAAGAWNTYYCSSMAVSVSIGRPRIVHVRPTMYSWSA